MILICHAVASKPRLAAIVEELPERERLQRFRARTAGNFACAYGNHILLERPGRQIIVAAPKQNNRVTGFSQYRDEAGADE